MTVRAFDHLDTQFSVNYTACAVAEPADHPSVRQASSVTAAHLNDHCDVTVTLLGAAHLGQLLAHEAVVGVRTLSCRQAAIAAGQLRRRGSKLFSQIRNLLE